MDCCSRLPDTWRGAALAKGRNAMVFQRPVLLRRSARANLVHALSLHGVPRGERRARADAALDRFGLMPIADRPARVLSGGEQQRLAIARAWALEPQVLFLDEPSSALDPGATRSIEEMIRVIQHDGVKIVMATHDLGPGAAACRRRGLSQSRAPAGAHAGRRVLCFAEERGSPSLPARRAVVVTKRGDDR